ncbi:MAG TPA: rhomboid-like protein [Kineosporiaceae bacterium]|nr:rhomboid-like protein [Kineosporiaceae bacterium]
MTSRPPTPSPEPSPPETPLPPLVPAVRPVAGRGVRWWTSRVVVAAGYGAMLLAGTLLVQSRDATGRQAVLQWVSTSVDNLLDHPVEAMVASAFVIEGGEPYGWLVLAVAGLVALAWRLGPWRTLAVAGAAHVLGTLVSEGIVAWRVHQGLLPQASRRLLDVGPSYVVVAALVGAVVAGPLACRIVGAAGFAVLAPTLFDGLADLDVPAVGHVCAVVLGAGLAAVLRPRRVARPPMISPRAAPPGR